ncbi:MAG: hypothetical protein WA981_06505 [Glaciecola sp.]
MNYEGSQEFCLDEQFRIPLDCIFEEGKPSLRCSILTDLAERNKGKTNSTIKDDTKE